MKISCGRNYQNYFLLLSISMNLFTTVFSSSVKSSNLSLFSMLTTRYFGLLFLKTTASPSRSTAFAFEGSAVKSVNRISEKPKLFFGHKTKAAVNVIITFEKCFSNQLSFYPVKDISISRQTFIIFHVAYRTLFDLWQKVYEIKLQMSHYRRGISSISKVSSESHLSG